MQKKHKLLSKAIIVEFQVFLKYDTSILSKVILASHLKVQIGVMRH